MWSGSLLRVHRILDARDAVDLDIAQFVADFLDAADVDRLDDVARFRIDQ